MTDLDEKVNKTEIDKSRITMVLLDINLPAGDGFGVAERIFEQSSTALPIIFITASKDPDFLEKARDMGAAGYFEKPYEAQELLDAIKEILEA